MERTFRIVIYSGAPPNALRHFLWRLDTDLPEVRVSGVLYCRRKPPLSMSRRTQRFFRLLPDPQFRALVYHKLRTQTRSGLARIFDSFLHILHCCPQDPNGPPLTLEALARDCESHGTKFYSTSEAHGTQSLSFVRSLDANLGVIFATGILKPELYAIPTNGSINIHKHKLPEYRGSGPPGLWEMRDDKTTVTVSVHRVVQAVDAGAILGERTFSIDPLDSLASVGLKADLLGIDLLIDVIRAESAGRSVETPQTEGTVYKGFKDHQIFAIERSIQSKRGGYQPSGVRPMHSLVARSLAYPALYFRNRRRRRRRGFPVIILYHHLIADKPQYLGLPTEQFARHVRFLKKHYRIASLPEALEMLRTSNVPLPTVVLTFDDGYAENFMTLRAVAEVEAVPVTLFVCTERVSRQAAFDHDLERNEAGFVALSWDQVRYFDRHGVTIGSHTRNHFDCTSTDLGALESEIVGSSDDLRRELGHDVDLFSFPIGLEPNISKVALSLASRTYRYTFSAFGGENYSSAAQSGHLYRPPYPSSLWELELSLQSVLELDGNQRASAFAVTRRIQNAGTRGPANRQTD
jgi:peptidoglycan/xylan/chitin deacetylase (PgdA/CDA1 family)